ncbi:hypothetical protein SAMN05428966_12228 [Massilia sp. PDC64]|nr:Rap1a/Tai family immunity protein [Massilia sp. PDC64]SDF79278.1 hypothetical protein SAMN05428966_12228 [Massilia sp. PDC64]
MRAFLAIGLALASPCNAQPAGVTPWMTGHRLVKLLGNVDPAAVNWTPDSPFRTRAIAAEFEDARNRELVRGFIHGVHDATEGKAWCWSARYKPAPDELEEDARRALQQMSDTQLKRNAADLIVEGWRTKWPCPVDQRSKR